MRAVPGAPPSGACAALGVQIGHPADLSRRVHYLICFSELAGLTGAQGRWTVQAAGRAIARRPRRCLGNHELLVTRQVTQIVRCLDALAARGGLVERRFFTGLDGGTRGECATRRHERAGTKCPGCHTVEKPGHLNTWTRALRQGSAPFQRPAMLLFWPLTGKTIAASASCPIRRRAAPRIYPD